MAAQHISQVGGAIDRLGEGLGERLTNVTGRDLAVEAIDVCLAETWDGEAIRNASHPRHFFHCGFLVRGFQHKGVHAICDQKAVVILIKNNLSK